MCITKFENVTVQVGDQKNKVLFKFGEVYILRQIKNLLHGEKQVGSLIDTRDLI